MNVWVVGPSRSGTSMICGLLAAHGVFFGDCAQGDQDNPRGYFENLWLKEWMRTPRPGWPAVWLDRLRIEGWDGKPWGAKGGPGWWPWIRMTEPTVIALCYRPLDQIMASRRRHSWMEARESIPEHEWRWMEQIKLDAPCPVVSVQTADVATRDLTTVRPVFDALGVTIDDAVVQDWIDPGMWTVSG